MQNSAHSSGLDALVRELDILIRARYPLIAISTFEELRFRRLMNAVAQLERHRAKSLFVNARWPNSSIWSWGIHLSDNPDVRLQVDERTSGQLVQALLGLTESEIENARAKAAVAHRGIGPSALPLILDEKRSVIRQSGALTYSHPEPADHLGGYANLRTLLQESASYWSQEREQVSGDHDRLGRTAGERRHI